MCRIFGVLRKKSTEANSKHAMSLMVNYYYNALRDGNTHGYFLSAHNDKDEDVRSFLESKWLRYLFRNRKAKALHGHARRASVGHIEYKNIHGWEHGGWRFTHNGTLNLKYEHWGDKSTDSWDVFNYVFRTRGAKTHQQIVAALTTAFEEEQASNNGIGVYAITNDKYTILASVNKPAYLTFYEDEGIMTYTSNEDLEVRNKQCIIELQELDGDGKMRKKKWEFKNNFPNSTAYEYLIFNEILVIENNKLDGVLQKDLLLYKKKTQDEKRN